MEHTIQKLRTNLLLFPLIMLLFSLVIFIVAELNLFNFNNDNKALMGIIGIVMIIGIMLYSMLITKVKIKKEVLEIIKNDSEFERFRPFLKEYILEENQLNYLILFNAFNKYKKSLLRNNHYLIEFMNNVIKEDDSISHHNEEFTYKEKSKDFLNEICKRLLEIESQFKEKNLEMLEAEISHSLATFIVNNSLVNDFGESDHIKRYFNKYQQYIHSSTIKKGKNIYLNIFGKEGSGKTSVLKKIDINKKDILLIDFKEDLEFQKSMEGARIISANFDIPIKKVIELIKNDLLITPTKFLIVDNADGFFEELEELFTFIINSEININIIIASQDKFTIDNNVDIEHIETSRMFKIDCVANQVNSIITITKIV